MARIEDIATQESIGWSLVGENAEQEAQEQVQADLQGESEYSGPGGALVDEVIDDHHLDVFKFGDDVMQARRGERPAEAQREQPERLRPEPASEAQEQPQAPTPAEVQAGVEKLDSAVKEYGLNEPTDARQFADEFCGAFGSDVFKSGVDVEALGGVMSKTALSALNVYAATGGDLSKMGDIPPQSAQAFAHDLLKGIGVDPRSLNVDTMLLARTTLGGMVNFLNSYQRYGGRVTDLAKLNDPQQAEFYLQNFLKAFGQEGPVNRATAVKFADACAKQMLRVMGRISQVQTQRNEARQKQTRSRGPRATAKEREAIRAARVPRFRTNAGPGEPFDAETMDTYAERSLRL